MELFGFDIQTKAQRQKHIANEAKRQQEHDVRIKKLNQLEDRRIRAIRSITQFRNAHYESANTGRWENDWLTTLNTPYNDIKGALTKLIARSRRLVDNCGFAANAVDVIVDNTVSTGLRPVPLVQKRDGSPDEIVNADLRRAFDIFNDEFDRSRKSSFYECQALALRTIIDCGSVLTNEVRSPGTFLPIAFQIREPDRLDTTYDDSKKSITQNSLAAQVVHGIAVDEYDVPVAYYLQGMEKPISAKFMRIFYRRQRPEQYIGVPWWTPVLKRLWDVQNLIEDQAIKSRITAMIALWFENDSGVTPLGSQDTDDDNFEWAPGAVGRGPVGSKPQIIQADDKIKDGYVPILRILLREVAVAMGLSYASLTRDLEEMNFAATRALILDERRHHTGVIKWFSDEFCQPHYSEFVKWCAINNKVRGLTIDRYNRDPYKYNNCFWVPRPWDWVDPQADVNALVTLKEAGLMTDEMYLQGRGIGVREFYEKLKEEMDMKKRLGLTPDMGDADGNQENENSDEDSGDSQSSQREDSREE